MLTSKFLTATLAALTVVGTAGLVYAQTTATPESTTQAQPAAPSTTTGMNRNTGAMNPGTGTMSQGTGTVGQGSGTMSPGAGTTGQSVDTPTPGTTNNQRLAARADRN